MSTVPCETSQDMDYGQNKKPGKAFQALRGFEGYLFGGTCGDRTCDSLLKRQILYRLS